MTHVYIPLQLKRCLIKDDDDHVHYIREATFFSSFVVCFRAKPPNCRFWAFFGSDLGEAKDDPAGTLHYAKPAFLREAVFGRFCAKAVFKQM